LFIDVFGQTGERTQFWRGTASAGSLQALLGRFLGPARAADLFLSFARSRGLESAEALEADGELVRFTEVQLSGAIGSASARAMVASVVQEEPLRADEVMTIIDEASQAIAQSQLLAAKQAELERATRELQSANTRLRELDHLKDDFISTVTHELRTPLTSIRAFSEILHDNPDIDANERQRFLGILVSESERLSRLINQVLDLAKLESGAAEWKVSSLDLRDTVNAAVQATMPLFKSKLIDVSTDLAAAVPRVDADPDRLMQVMMNLLSNASKFCASHHGAVCVRVVAADRAVRVEVSDNGIGIAPANQQLIFEKFRQVGDTMTDKPAGTGLGLAICREIVGHFGGRLWVESSEGAGATFAFSLPIAGEGRVP
jgi:signal transduction histidine kinase